MPSGGFWNLVYLIIAVLLIVFLANLLFGGDTDALEMTKALSILRA